MTETDDTRRDAAQEPGQSRDAAQDTARDSAQDTAQDETRRKGAAETFTEEFRVSGEALVAKVKALVREGNIRRISIKNDEGRTLIEIPLTIGVIGTALLPVWAAIGAIAALVANLTLTVERVDESTAPTPDAAAAADVAPPATGDAA